MTLIIKCFLEPKICLCYAYVVVHFTHGHAISNLGDKHFQKFMRLSIMPLRCLIGFPDSSLRGYVY